MEAMSRTSDRIYSLQAKIQTRELPIQSRIATVTHLVPYVHLVFEIIIYGLKQTLMKLPLHV